MRGGTFLLTLPDGRKVRCRVSEAKAIRDDVRMTGNVMLVKAAGSDVYERVAPGSAEAELLAPTARKVERP